MGAVMSNGERRRGEEGPPTPPPPPPPSTTTHPLRTLRFGDRTISYDHEGGGGGGGGGECADEKNVVVGGKINFGVEGEGETEGRRTENSDS